MLEKKEEPKEAKGVIANLFDLSFKEFVTPKLIKILYVVFLVLGALIALVMLISSVMSGSFGIIGGLIGAPVFFVVYLFTTRVWLELLLVIFAIEKHLRSMSEK